MTCRDAAASASAWTLNPALSEDFVQSLEYAGELFLGGVSDPSTDAVHRERPNLTDLHPGAFGESGRPTLEGQREAGARLLTRHRQRNDGSGSFVEDIVADDKNRALAHLLASADGIQIGPADLTSQYSGHESSTSARPSSARRFSWAGLSFAASRAKRVRASR